MKTAALFHRAPALASQLTAGGVQWLQANRATVLAMSSQYGLPQTMVRAAIADDLAESAVTTAGDITVVIPCHNYGMLLGECLDSLRYSTLPPKRVIVIDDASDRSLPYLKPDGRNLPFDLEQHRVDFRDQSKVCRFGFQFVTTKYVAFLDADDKVHPEYFARSVRQIEADRSVAFVYPWLQAFGDASGPRHGTEHSPAAITATDIESRNWCPAGSLYRSQVLRQTLAMQRDRDSGCICNDWITARGTLRGGAWKAVRAEVPLHYRIHPGQSHTTKPGTYWQQADLANETVTVVVAFSGRWKQWTEVRRWLETQTWPRHQLRLLILNSTHQFLTPAALHLDHFECASLQIERIDVGYPGLADINRKTASPDVPAAVEAAVAGLYNAAVPIVRGEWILFLEDDTVPFWRDSIARLMRRVGWKTAAVSGLYKHRYESAAVAFRLKEHVADLLPMAGPDLEEVAGSGFGCLLARRSVLLQFPFAGDSRFRFYDVDAARISKAGWQWMLDRTVPCDHLTD
jgi:glycosyltransferase involved in cell wall biosynthesis